jgi:hypothetical protein
MKRKLVDTALALCTVGGALFAIGASKEPLSRIVSLPDYAYGLFLVLGGILATAGGLAFVFSLFAEPVQSGVERVIYGDVGSRHICTHANADDLRGLHALYSRYFGADVPSIELMNQWLNRCKSAFTLLHSVTQDSGLITAQQLVGSFKLLPLTAEGVKALDLGQVTGSTFRPEHICSDRRRPAAYYLGDVVATTRFARAVILAQLNAACAQVTNRNISIYARPLTADGRRIMTKYGFAQVSDGRSAPEVGRICKLEIVQKSALQPPGAGQKTHRRRLTPLGDA